MRYFVILLVLLCAGCQSRLELSAQHAFWDFTSHCRDDTIRTSYSAEGDKARLEITCTLSK